MNSSSFRRVLALMAIITIVVVLTSMPARASLSGFSKIVWHYPFTSHGGPLNATLSSSSQIDNMVRLGFSGIMTTAPDWQLSTSDALQYKSFLDYARGHGFVVFGVTMEDPAFVTQDNYLSIATTTMNNVISQSNTNGYGFQKYLIDVEPQTTYGWTHGNQTLYLNRLINLTQTLHNLLSPLGLDLTAAVPYWFGPLLKSINPNGFNALVVDELVVYVYNTSYQFIASTTTQLLGNVTAPLIPVANIMPNSTDPSISYNDFNTLTQILLNQHNTSPSLVGVSAFQSKGLPSGFTITSNPTTVAMLAGSTGNSTITVNGTGTFTGTVNLAATTNSTGLACALSPNSVTITSIGASGSSELSCSGSRGNYSVTVNGTSTGSQSSTATMGFSVKDFDIHTSATTIGPLFAGVSGNATITVSWCCVSGINDLVALTANPSVGLTSSLGPVSVTGTGSSTLTVSATEANTYTVSVTGASGPLSHTTATITVTVIPLRPTSTSISCIPSTLMVGQITSCTATVNDTSSNPTTPTGTVTFTPNGTCMLSGTGPSATCSASVTPTVAGTSTISASYDGDGTHGPSSGITTVTVNLRTTTTTVACNPTTVSVGQGSLCTATVTDTASGTTSTPTGTATLAPGGTCTLGGTGPSATCSVNVTPTATGTLTVSANYGGDTTHGPSAGSTSITVNTITTATTVACSPSIVVVGQATMCTATVNDTSTGTTTTPTGTITFTSGGTCALGGTGASAACSVSYTATTAGTGVQNIGASYGGDSGHSPSTATPPFALTVNVQGLLAQYWGNSFFGETNTCTPYNSVIVPISSPDLNATEPNVSYGASTGFNWHPFDYSTFSVKWTGYIYSSMPGTYVFSLTSDDGSWLYIDQSLIVNNGGSHGTQTTTNTDPLSQGLHTIEVDFYETCSGGSGVDLSWMPPGAPSLVIVPSNVLSSGPPFDYALSLTPASATKTTPGSLSASVTATLTSGASQVVTLSYAINGPSTPAGSITLTFGTNPVSPSGSSLVTITVTSLAVNGNYAITISGSPATVSSGAVTFQLSVNFPSVGGIVVPVDKLALLAPYIGFASVVAALAVTSVLSLKRAIGKKKLTRLVPGLHSKE
jgi:hypothetical protein